MAIVSNGWIITLTVADTGANTSTLEFSCRAANHGAAQAAATILTGLWASVSDSVIQRMAISEVYVNDAFAYPAEAETANKASLTVTIDGESGKKANLKIPAPTDAIFVAATGSGYNVVDTGDADVLAYVAMFETGAQFYLSDGEDVGVLVSGKRIHAKQYDG